MHVVNGMDFFVTLLLCITLTTLMSRIGLMLIRRSGFTFGKLTAVHGISLAVSWLLFVIWCSTETEIYWFAGHVAFPPQALWFIWDILHSQDYTSEEEEADEAGFDAGRRE